MKTIFITITALILNSQAFANNSERYDRNRIQNYIEHTGTTSEPLIQIQALAGAMAAYNTLYNVDEVLKLNKVIIKQNEEILRILKKH